MSKVIDYYFGPISGYAYLGHAALMALARETGARVRFLPIDMLKVYEASGLRPPYDQSDAARSYRVEDQRRLARMRGLRMKVGPENYPADTRLACRVILAAGRLGLDQDSIAMACLRGTWAEGRNIADPGDLGEALRQIDMPCVELGPARIVLFPGETYVGYQLMAQQLQPDKFVLSIGFGECWPGYIPTRRAFEENFGHSWRWVAPGSDRQLEAALRKVLAH